MLGRSGFSIAHLLSDPQGHSARHVPGTYSSFSISFCLFLFLATVPESGVFLTHALWFDQLTFCSYPSSLPLQDSRPKCASRGVLESGAEEDRRPVVGGEEILWDRPSLWTVVWPFPYANVGDVSWRELGRPELGADWAPAAD